MSVKRNLTHSKIFQFAILFLAFISVFLIPYSPSLGIETPFPAIPPEYGEVIYRYNESSLNRLFIIGISHRDFISRLNGPNTPRVQAEVYKIGEWLAQNQGLELLLPEGYFKKQDQTTTKAKNPTFRPAGLKDFPEPLDIKEAEEKLSGAAFVNAEMLLLKYNHMRARQVEDQEWYEASGSLLRTLAGSGNPLQAKLVTAELDYLQERRTAAMLQKIPEVIKGEYEKGDIRGKTAIFTIGMSHLPKIIKYLEESKIRISSPWANSNDEADYVSDVNLVKENFGVVIILPRALINDREALQIIPLKTPERHQIQIKQSRAGAGP